jgi:hypothetical protein
MYAKTTLMSLALFALSAMALPAKRDSNAFVDMCQSKNLGGTCQTMEIPLDTCTQITNGYSGKVSSVQVVSTGVSCTWYLNQDCSGKTYDNQDDMNLTDGNGQFARMMAAKCSASS